MGIVNINDDSFSGDGSLDVEKALRQAVQMVKDGADIIDVGAESARTNREAIAEAEEVSRLLPFLEAFETACKEIEPRDELQMWPPRLSVNTWRSKVVEVALGTGRVHIINDIGGLVEDTNARLCCEFGVSLLVMHTVGLPSGLVEWAWTRTISFSIPGSISRNSVRITWRSIGTSSD
jgi:dihydropteroate synthase